MTSDLVDLLLRAGALKFGDFTLKSGRRSPYFVDFGALYRGRDLTEAGRLFARMLQEALPGGYDVVYGPAYKALPLAVATCQQLWTEHGLDVPYLSARKEAKTHGEGGLFLGPKARGGERVVILDDVMTSGGTKHEALQTIEAWGGRAVAVLVGLDREEDDASATFTQQTGVPVLSLARARDLLERRA